jgi:hypothetical protein
LLLCRKKKEVAEEREMLEGEEGESRGGGLVAGWLPMVELVFVVYRLGLLVFSLEKATVEEVERAAEG